MDDTPGARIVQAPLLVSDGVYDRKAILTNLPISNDTFDKWLKRGLPFFQEDTRAMLFVGADVIAFFRQHRRRKGD